MGTGGMRTKISSLLKEIQAQHYKGLDRRRENCEGGMVGTGEKRTKIASLLQEVQRQH